ncbi:MAG: glycine cleavage system protein R [Alphaproteobacteria bacterium]|jgi:glycine cleavage system regulatory protein|nr:glycine cleavage system protein R [Alphaproteobacteria bacterium]
MATPKIQTLVITFIADDRPGLVERLSEAVTGAGGNWLESRMARLAAKFAGIARIEIAADKTPALKVALAALEADGFNLNIEGAAVEAAPGGVAGASGAVFNLELLGPDHPGIVRDVTHCLSEQGVSVEEMQTNLLRAPMGGDILFQAQARVRLPDDLSEDSLRDALEALAEALMVDLTLREGDA